MPGANLNRSGCCCGCCWWASDGCFATGVGAGVGRAPGPASFVDDDDDDGKDADSGSGSEGEEVAPVDEALMSCILPLEYWGRLAAADDPTS